MKQKAKQLTVKELWHQLPLETVQKIADISKGDGHTIYKHEAYRDAGMSLPLLNHFTRVFESDGTPKGSITANDGTPIDELKGVYGLNVIESLASAFDLKTGAFMGRGFRAQAAYRLVNEYLDQCRKIDGQFH